MVIELNPFTLLLFFLWLVVFIMLKFIIKSLWSKKNIAIERSNLEETRNKLSEAEYKRKILELTSKNESNYIVVLGISLLLLYGLPLIIATYLYVRYYL